MNKKQIWAVIIGAGLVASLSTAAIYFPDVKVILISGATLVSAIVAFLTGVTLQ